MAVDNVDITRQLYLYRMELERQYRMATDGRRMKAYNREKANQEYDHAVAYERICKERLDEVKEVIEGMKNG